MCAVFSKFINSCQLDLKYLTKVMVVVVNSGFFSQSLGDNQDKNLVSGNQHDDDGCKL